MQKDLQSYRVHDQEFRDAKLNNIQAISDLYKRYDEEKQYEITGFDRAISSTKDLPQTHIDVGCGGGWLLRKTAPLFKEVIGVEPSAEGIGYAKQLLSTQFPNITFINAEMVEGITTCINKGKVFITTSIVLSHIEDSYVASFLKELARFENGSILFFDERYGKNIHRNLWHIRSKEWWAKNLPDWQLEFYGLSNTGYASGIYGVKVGKDKVVNTFKMNMIARTVWSLQGILYTFVNRLKSLLKKI